MSTADATTGFDQIAETLERLEQDNTRVRALIAERLTALEQEVHALDPRHDPVAPEAQPPQATPAVHPAGPLPSAPGTTYRLTSPLMRSTHLRGFQRALNRFFRDRKVNFRIDDDGEYGPETRRAARRAAFALGIAMRELDDGLTPEVRRKIRHPELRSAAEKAREEHRKGWLARLRKRFEGGGPAQAIAYARKHLGVTESPPGSNRGPLIDKWNRAVGTPPGPNAFWCGAFVNACLVAAGFTPKPWMKSCIQIEQHARGGIDGWSFHSSPVPGDLVLYTEKGVAGHVGLVLGMQGGMLHTIEGNTSRQGSTSSQSNGGGVFERHRNPHDPTLPVRGYARPPYRH